MDNYPIDQEKCSKNYWSRFQYSRNQLLKKENQIKFLFEDAQTQDPKWTTYSYQKNNPISTSLLVEILLVFDYSPLLLYPPHLHRTCEQIAADYHGTFMIQHAICFDWIKSIVNIFNNYLGTSEDIHTCLFHSNLEKRNQVSQLHAMNIALKIAKFWAKWLFCWIFWWNLMEEEECIGKKTKKEKQR